MENEAAAAMVEIPPMPKEEDKDKLTIPEDYRERIQTMSDEDAMNDIKLDIASRKKDDAVAKYDAEAAFLARQEGVALSVKGRALHKALWDTIHEAIPETKHGQWVLDLSEMTVERKSRGRGIGGLMASLGGAMGN